MATGRILVVDDDAAFVDALAIYLEDQGFNVTSATTGRKGIIESGRQSIDVALVDVNLPDTDGLQVVSQVRRLQPSVSFVLISSDDSPDTVSKCSAPRNCIFMAKPLSPKVLLDVVARLVGTGRTPSSLVAN